MTNSEGGALPPETEKDQDCSKRVTVPTRGVQGLNEQRNFVTRYIPDRAACALLAHHLGKTPEAWDDFLHADRLGEDHQDIPWEYAHGRVVYAEVDVYAYIASQKPCMFSEEMRPLRRENPYGFHPFVRLDIDYEDGARPFIRMESLEASIGQTGLTPTEARTLANELLELADDCERIYPSRILQILGVEVAMLSGSNPSGSTGDRKLDSMLRDLGHCAGPTAADRTEA